MPADPAPIVTAARQRHELTRAKVLKALRELDRAGTPVTFQTVAAAAGVSRSWLYTQPDIRTDVQRLREATRRAPAPPIPAVQRTSDASARARLRAAVERNKALAEDNQRLRRQLAQALGEQPQQPRATAESRLGRTRTGHGSATVGPCP